LNDVIEISIQNNKELAAFQLQIEKYKIWEKTAFDLEKTNFYYGSDENNIAANGYPLKVWGLSQDFRFPSTYTAEKHTKQIESSMAIYQMNIQKNLLLKDISACYFEYQLFLNKEKMYLTLDSLYNELLLNARKKFNKGDLSHLEVLNIKAKKNQVASLLKTNTYDISKCYMKLKMLMNHQADFSINENMEIFPETSENTDSTTEYQLISLKNKHTEALLLLEKRKLLPDLSLNYFLGTNFHKQSAYYHGFEIGLSLPLFYGSQKAKIHAARIANTAQNYLSEYETEKLNNKKNDLMKERGKYLDLIEHYRQFAKPLYDEIIRTSIITYHSGEINFYQFINSYETALAIQMEHINNLCQYKIINAELQYFTK
jgi:heavy metal efflux system protein